MQRGGPLCAALAAALLVGVDASAPAGVGHLSLELTTAISPAPATRGRPATFEIRAENRGAAPVANVRLELELLGGDRVVSTSVPCATGRGVSCRVGTIAPGGEAAVAITLRPRMLDVGSRLVTSRSDQGVGHAVAWLLVCTIVGTPGSDRIRGTPSADFICGAGGSDRIDAGSGDDRVLGTGRLHGGAGRDGLLVRSGLMQRDSEHSVPMPPPNGTLVDGGTGDDFVWGEDGRDLIRGGRGRDEIEGWGGGDRLLGGGGADELNGGEGDDVLDGGEGDDALAGHHGDDLVRGGRGDDVVRGGYFNDSNERFRPGGDDRLLGGAGRDRVVGGKGRDVVVGGSGPDELFGGLGDDLLLAADGSPDRIDGRRGFDRARIDPFDRVMSVERISGR